MEDIQVKQILVIDISPNTTAEQAEEVLNRPFEDGYYLTSIIGWDKFSARAFYRRRVRGVEASASGAASAKTGSNKANRDGKDDAAKAIIRANLSMTVPALVARLNEAGIDRKKTWVGDARLEARGRSCRVPQV